MGRPLFVLLKAGILVTEFLNTFIIGHYVINMTHDGIVEPSIRGLTLFTGLIKWLKWKEVGPIPFSLSWFKLL